MSVILVAQIAILALVLGGGAAVLLSAHRYRKHQRLLERIASKHALAPAPKPVPAALATRSGRHEGRDATARLRNVMVGRGESATVVLADRKIAGVHHSMVMFELSRSAHLDGFFVRPDDGDALQLQWRGPRATWNDQRALSMGARVMYNLATVGDRKGAEPLGLEVQGERVWVHTRTRLRGEELERFVDDAMRLRAMMGRSLDRTHAAPSSAGARSRSGGPRSRPSVARDDEVTVLTKA